MQSVSSRIWTCVAVSISYDDNHYTTGNFLFIINVTTAPKSNSNKFNKRLQSDVSSEERGKGREKERKRKRER